MGCTPSKNNTVPSGNNVTAVGSTERNLSRNEVRKKQRTESNHHRHDHDGAERVLPALDSSGKLTEAEIVLRTTHSETTKSMTVGTEEFPIQIEYAYWSQRGYYPDDVFKENQDDLSVTRRLAGDSRSAMFTVLDGHGTKGHTCARYAKHHLPRTVEKYIRQSRVQKYRAVLKSQGMLKGAKLFDPDQWPPLTSKEYEKCYRKAILECNKEMKQSSEVDANLSGTTAISVSFHGHSITVCNVGDSRAILGHRTNDHKGGGETKTERLVAIPLSRDHTPYRKDERERVRQAGAAVMSIDQLEGHEAMHDNFGDLVLGASIDLHGDPPRVWVEGKNYPGCAFTRSLGDTLGESVGVFAEPEMITRELTMNDEVLVLATDGIFEFLTNQEVIDMSRHCGSPLNACECLVEAAYKQWLTYERRTDDITVIVCFLKSNKPIPNESIDGTTEDLLDSIDTTYGTKPVRRPRGKNDALYCTSMPDDLHKN